MYLFNPSLQSCGVHVFHKDCWEDPHVSKWRRVAGETELTVIPRCSQNLSKIGCYMSAPRYRYDFDIPGVECMLKMPFFSLPCALCCTRKPWRVCSLPQRRDWWALWRFRGVELTLCTYLLTNYFCVSKSMSVAVLLH